MAATERITALELSISHDCFKVKKYCNEQWNIVQAAAVAAAAAAVAAALARASEVVFLHKKALNHCMCLIVMRSAMCNPFTVSLIKNVADAW